MKAPVYKIGADNLLRKEFLTDHRDVQKLLCLSKGAFKPIKRKNIQSSSQSTFWYIPLFCDWLSHLISLS